MFRWIVLSQAALYLVVMPFLRAQGEPGYYPPILVGLVGVLALAFGMRIHRPQPNLASAGGGHGGKLIPREYLWIGVIVVAFAYAVVAFQFGLLNRRQGSEMMAEIFGTMPLWQLAIIRGYELMLPPLIILYVFSAQRIPTYQSVAVGAAILFSLPFMGVADSRGRLLVLAITILAFVPARLFFERALKSVNFYVAGIISLGAFFYFNVVRAGYYYSLAEFLHVEIFQRLDGLNLITKLRDARLFSYFGEFDFMILSPIIARIPFLDAARQAKLMGRTSSKQYYIQDVLKNNNLDDSNSMIADPLYFGGVIGLIISFTIFGYFVAKFDSFVARGGLFEGRQSTALAIGFGTSFIMFENDFVFSIVSFVQAYVFALVLLSIGCSRPRVGADPLRPGKPAGSYLA